MSDSSDPVGAVSRAVVRESLDVGIESADGCLWVVIELDVGDVELEASICPADSEVLYRDLRGGVTRERLESARLEAAAK